MSIYIMKNGEKQQLIIPASDVQILDVDGNFKSNNLEDALKEVGGATEENVAKIEEKVEENSIQLKEIINSTEINITRIEKKVDINTTLLSKLSNPNLLINGDFQVWQRGSGFSNNTINPMYTADRWRILSDSSMEVRQQPYGVSIEVTKSGSWHNFEQYIELPKYLNGKTVTVSIKLHSKGVIKQFYAGVKKSNLSEDKTVTSVFNSTETDLFTNTFTIPTGNYTFLYIGIQTTEKLGSILEIEYIKLESGEIATPFIHRLYCEELALCQRYFETVRFYGSATEGMTQLSSSIPFKVTKRMIPTSKDLRSSVRDTSLGWIQKEADVSAYRNVECCHFSIGSTNPIIDVQVSVSADAEIY